jgi:hypothetical protein
MKVLVLVCLPAVATLVLLHLVCAQGPQILNAVPKTSALPLQAVVPACKPLFVPHKAEILMLVIALVQMTCNVV